MSTGVGTAIDRATTRLAAAGVPSARHDAEALAAYVLGRSRTSLAGVVDLDDVQEKDYEDVVRRRESREPLQHITGRAAFRYLELEVGAGVFVPRPETEVMTGVAVAELQRLVHAGLEPTAVDLCTGSGAVAIALGTEVREARVIGVELSPEAAAYAARNASGTGIEIRVGDVADAARDLHHVARAVHVVTANPPYIPLDAWESVDEEARAHDPGMALWSGTDGLDAIRLVAQVAAPLLVDDGLVVCEHADVQGDSAPQVFVDTGHWREVRDHPDLTGRPRFVTARRVPRTVASAGTIAP